MTISYLGQTYTIDQTYSFKDLTSRSLASASLSGKVIYCSCFSHEVPDSVVFPANMTGTTFINCNLDNVYVPPGNTVLGGSARRFKAQEDGCDWLVDSNLVPTGRL